MNDKIVECVPNFSEGRRKEVIDAIAKAISDTAGCALLDVDPGAATNRTVYTFVGAPDAVVQGALAAAQVAYRLIDMRKHTGEHPRMGALDVCPFIPVSNVSMDECVECSLNFGKQLAEALSVPVYLYEFASRKEHRKALSQIRAGEYEGLEKKLSLDEWVPDFGPAKFVPQWGATVAGARKFLIAYNVNVLGTKEQAHRIALNVREQGRGPGQEGRLKTVKGLGWFLDDQNIAQISMNLTDFETTPIHVAYEECCKDAKELGVAVAGSEIVGLLPLRSVLMAADYYIQKEGLFVLDEELKVRLAIDRLGLSSLKHFKPEEKIIEYKMGRNKDGGLVNLSVRKFVESIAARTPAPGGGSAAACIASIGAALGTMAGLLTYGNRKFEHLDGVMRASIAPLYTAMMSLLPLVESDSRAFSEYMTALKLPSGNEEETKIRKMAIQNGMKKAIQVPLTVMRSARECWSHMEILAKHANVTVLSDLQVGVCSLDTGIQGASFNVAINLGQLNDAEYREEVQKEVDVIVKESDEKRHTLLAILKTRLKC